MYYLDDDKIAHYVCDSCGRSQIGQDGLPCCWDMTEGGPKDLDFCQWCAERRMDAAYRGQTCHCCPARRKSVETAVERMAKGDTQDPDLLDNEVDAWHEETHPQVPLWVWLGMTRYEYSEWVRDPNYIYVIVEDRKKILDTKNTYPGFHFTF